MKHSPIPARASRTQDYLLQSDIEDDDAYYPQRQPSSAIRYQDTRGNQVIQRGKHVSSSMRNRRQRSGAIGRSLLPLVC